MWISTIFGCQSSILHTSVNNHIDIQARILMQGRMDVRGTQISTHGNPCFYGYQSLIICSY